MPDGLTLILPGEELKERHWLCTSCGRKYPFHHEARWERHVIECARRNMPNIEEHIAGKASNVFQSPADEELYRHIRAGGN